MWCNFGSFVGLFGGAGQPDYTAGNALLNTAAEYSASVLGEDEFTIGWSVWSETGMIRMSYYRTIAEVIHSLGTFSMMSTAEGVHHFIRELNLPQHEPVTLHLGSPEKRPVRERHPQAAQFIHRYCPSLFDGAPPPDAAQDSDFYIDRRISGGADEATFERVFDLSRDAYLRDHVVNGYPTLPGTFVPEIAAQAAIRLVPGMAVIGFEDLEFHQFLRVYGEDKPTRAHIEARVTERSAARTIVAVRVLTDVVTPDGVVLQKDRVHFTLDVVLAHRHPEAPTWQPWHLAPERPAVDAYHLPGAPIVLTGCFVSTKDTRLHPQGKRATYCEPVASDDVLFGRFATSSLLLDGLARVAALTADPRAPLAAPRRIRRIALYEATNDAQLAARGERIELYAFGDGLDAAV